MAITIMITDEAWTILKNQRQRKETFADVIDRLLKLNKGGKKNEYNKN